MLERLGAEELAPRVFRLDAAQGRTGAMVLERLGAEVILLVEGRELCIIVMRGCRGSANDRVIRVLKRGGIVDPRTLWGDTTVALLTEAGCRELVEKDMHVIRSMCSEVVRIDVSPARLVDRRRLVSMVIECVKRAPRRLLDAVGAAPRDIVDAWRRALYGGAALEDLPPDHRS